MEKPAFLEEREKGLIGKQLPHRKEDIEGVMEVNDIDLPVNILNF